VVIATDSHRAAFDDALRAHGVDGSAAAATGQFTCLDAADTLARFMVGASPDRNRFMSVIGEVVEQAAAGGRSVRAFGEMVALLWDAGNVSGAVELEALWNELATTHRFFLYCAYPIAALTAGGDLAAASLVCDHHSDVVAPLSYAVSTGPAVPADDIGESSELFVPVPAALAAVRRFVRMTLAGWNEVERSYDTMLVASELATNAVLHASSAFRVTLRRSDTMIWVGVQDISVASPERRTPSRDTPGGRGIAFVERVSARWGTEHRSDGKIVWAELPRAGHR
jgi:anti-sigma regulatory factor (Ser/Thr protein kinase)